jgi:predicted alpha/beta-fold hydrolase
MKLTDRIILTHAKETCQIKYKSPVNKQIKEMSLIQMLNVTCPSLTDPRKSFFKVHPLLLSGHLQTLYASLYAEYIHKPRVNYTREVLETEDGGIFSLDWTELPIMTNKRTPYVLICHGLTGGSHETYVQDLIIAVKVYGYRSIVMNFRGCSETPLKSAQLYSGSFTKDLDLSVNHILKKDPNASIIGVGFSLGSNVLLKYAGQQGKNLKMVGVVSVGNPYDFLGSLRALDRTFLGRNVYSTKMGSSLKKMFRKHEVHFEGCDWLDLKQIDEVFYD